MSHESMYIQMFNTCMNQIQRFKQKLSTVSSDFVFLNLY